MMTVPAWTGAPDNLLWRKSAACRGMNPDMFFPGRGMNPGQPVAVCATCPVRQPCLEAAVVHRDVDGIYGGTTGRMRRHIRKVWQDAGHIPTKTDKRLPPHGTAARFLVEYEAGVPPCQWCRAAYRDAIRRWNTP